MLSDYPWILPPPLFWDSLYPSWLPKILADSTLSSPSLCTCHSSSGNTPPIFVLLTALHPQSHLQETIPSSLSLDETSHSDIPSAPFISNFLNYLLLVALGLHCCAWAFSSCAEWGAAHGLPMGPTAVASFVAENTI